MSIEEADRWLDEHGSALYSFALMHLRNPHQAEDAVQETLLAALQARRRYTGSASVRTWLTGILKHKILDELRRQSRDASEIDAQEQALENHEQSRLSGEFSDDGHWSHALSNWGNPEGNLYSEQIWAIIERCLAVLSPRTARLFMLRELWEMDTKTVCEELAISENNLWTSLHRARLGIRQCLENNGLG